MFFISAVVCLSNISSGNSKSCSDDEGQIVTQGNKLKITLQNGSKYVFDDVKVVESSQDNDKYTLKLDDNSNIEVLDNRINVTFDKPDNVRINNVSKATKDGNDVIFDLENGERLVVKDAENYEDLGDNVYSLGTNKETRIKTKPKRRRSNPDKDDESSETNSTDKVVLGVLLSTLISAIILL